jgi:hypothetical protein
MKRGPKGRELRLWGRGKVEVSGWGRPWESGGFGGFGEHLSLLSLTSA